MGQNKIYNGQRRTISNLVVKPTRPITLQTFHFTPFLKIISFQHLFQKKLNGAAMIHVDSYGSCEKVQDHTGKRRLGARPMEAKCIQAAGDYHKP
ncbi:hypothetical protein, partial [Niallia circulans]|uniref:hypothetical protein n=1 Tax=Niallia circulans TaxID=1397 RepID=UPI001C3EF7EB